MAVVATWLALVAFGTGCLFASRGTAGDPLMDDLVNFGCSMALARAASPVTAFAIGGRIEWAYHLAFAIGLLVACAAPLLLYLLWYDPMILAMRMDRWSFERLQHAAAGWAEQLAGYHGPLGIAVGIAFGAPAGLLIMFGRRRPRLAAGTAPWPS